MKLNVAQQQFVDALGQDMVGWGLPRTTGRTYAYLLLAARPASLDEIIGALSVAKSGASVAARQLVAVGLARSAGEPGTRRIRYEALHDIDAIFAARDAQTHRFLGRLREGADVAPPGVARRRLTTLASLVQELTDELPALLRRIRERRRA
jgi:DNA-binding transcriptional regulator GbsR (MarR family)